MLDRSKPAQTKPRQLRMNAEPLQYALDLQDDPKFHFVNKVAMRKRRQRERDALEQEQHTITLHRDRLLRALTVDRLTDAEAKDPKKVDAEITRIINDWIAGLIGKIRL